MENKVNNNSFNLEVRPWGCYEVLYSDDKCKIKRIVVSPGKRLSLQSHKNRDETWKIISGKGLVEVIIRDFSPNIIKLKIDMNDIEYFEDSSFYIKRNEKHRISNIGTEPLVFIETQTGDSFEEEDIVRYEDDYGRVNQKEMEK